MVMRTPITILFVLSMIVSFAGSIQSVGADGVIIVDPPGCDPVCPAPTFVGDQLIVRSHKVEVEIVDQIATTSIDQVFFNPNDWTAEGTYLFPVPDGATVSDFAMIVDGEPIEATLLDADEARLIYEQTVRSMQDPALLEYVGQNAIQARVFPIGPGEEREVEITYQQVLTREKGLVRYVYPLNTERFSAEPLEQASIRVAVESDDPIRSVYSPSHPIAVDRSDPEHFVAGWEGSDVLPATNFELVYTVTTKPIGLNVLSSWDVAAGEGTMMLLVNPGIVADQPVAPKDVILVLDTSGSMEGEKLEQAREALAYVLGHLGAEDRFAVVEFSTGVRLFDDQPQPVSEAPEAIRWVARLEATGGTDIDGALENAMALVDQERPTYLLFLTDGLPTEGETAIGTIVDHVADQAPSNVRLFPFGVGDDVDTVLLDTLATEHHGATTYVRPGDSLDTAVASFYGSISTPVLTDLDLQIDGIRVEELFPLPLPDLFAGSQMVVVGRYREGGTGTISLTGTFDGQETTFRYDGQVFVSAGESQQDQNLARIWATRKIGYLLNQIRLYGENEEWVSAIVDLSIRYGIVTPYTSYLITEEDVFTAAGREAIANEAYEEARTDNAPTSGADAVQAAVAAGSLADSDVAAQTEFDQGTADVRIIGSRAFVLRDGVFVETTFDPETMDPVSVEFASDDYFDLVAENPDLADAFALGDRVIALNDGVAYEVTS